MTDETFTALQYAGPANWHHLIAPTRTFHLTEFSINSIAFALIPGDRELSGNEPAVRLGALAAAANKKLPQFIPNVSTYKHVARALRTNDPQVLSMLLIDIIRAANHITKS